MKIAEAMAYSNLTTFREQEVPKKVKTAMELATEIFAEAEEREQPFLYLTPEQWQRRWLPSKRFRLIRLPLNAAALPCDPKGENLVLKKMHAREEKPIVVDYNRRQVGKTINGFTPAVIVIDGKHRFKAASMRGDSHIMAWVGEVAIDELHAAKQMCACGCGGPAGMHAMGGGGGGPAPESTTPATGAKLVAEGKRIKQLNVEEVESAGTSEGASKGWDSRGRGSVRQATKNFPVWRSLGKAGFKEISQRRNDVRTFTGNIKTKSKFDGEPVNYHHRIDVKSDGSWRHTKGPAGTDMAVGRVHGRDLPSLDQHLTSGKYQSSFRNEGHKWNDVAETR